MRRVIGAALLALVMAACSSGAPSSAPVDSTTTTTAPKVVGSFQGPSTGRALTADAPLRVTLLGDSLLYDAAPAIEANFAATGVMQLTTFTLPGFGFGRGLSAAVGPDFDWRSVVVPAVSGVRPEVIIASFGIIDSYGMARGLQTPEAFTASVREALDIMTAGDTKVLLLGILPAIDGAGKPEMRPMNRDANPILRQIAGEYTGKVEFLDTDRLLTSTGEPVYFLNGLRVRKRDLIHLCSDGAALFATELNSTLARSWPIPPAAPGWALGPWRTDGRYDDPAGACVETIPGIGG